MVTEWFGWVPGRGANFRSKCRFYDNFCKKLLASLAKGMME
jgi:hypothetical protein